MADKSDAARRLDALRNSIVLRRKMKAILETIESLQRRT